jgi:glycosyltransferase involved in cell wall biosynthesis
MQSLAEEFVPATRARDWTVQRGQTGLASIIIPTFNREKLLDETIASAVAQTYRPIEIIVVDDGSTDNTSSLVDRWQQRCGQRSDTAIRYFHQSNSGVGSARNRGLIESRGEFIQFLDSDDVLHPRKLEIHIGLLQRYPESGYAFSHMTRLEDLREWPQISVELAKLSDAAEFYCSPLTLTMVGVYRRATCDAAGPWLEDMSLGEDEEWAFRALLSISKLVYLPQDLCAFRDHAGPRLTDLQKVRRGLEHALRTYTRMAMVAAARGRLDDPRLVTPLVQRMTSVIIEGMDMGCHDLANEAIQVCRKLPVKFGRRLRLAMYQLLNTLPSGWFPRIWSAWLKLRRSLRTIARQAA